MDVFDFLGLRGRRWAALEMFVGRMLIPWDVEGRLGFLCLEHPMGCKGGALSWDLFPPALPLSPLPGEL